VELCCCSLPISEPFHRSPFSIMSPLGSTVGRSRLALPRHRAYGNSGAARLARPPTHFTARLGRRTACGSHDHPPLSPLAPPRGRSPPPTAPLPPHRSGGSAPRPPPW